MNIAYNKIVRKNMETALIDLSAYFSLIIGANHLRFGHGNSRFTPIYISTFSFVLIMIMKSMLKIFYTFFRNRLIIQCKIFRQLKGLCSILPKIALLFILSCFLVSHSYDVSMLYYFFVLNDLLLYLFTLLAVLSNHAYLQS